jgi:hypothetical protein
MATVSSCARSFASFELSEVDDIPTASCSLFVIRDLRVHSVMLSHHAKPGRPSWQLRPYGTCFESTGLSVGRSKYNFVCLLSWQYIFWLVKFCESGWIREHSTPIIRRVVARIYRSKQVCVAICSPAIA